MRLEKYIVENLTLWQKLNSFAHKNIHTVIHTYKNIRTVEFMKLYFERRHLSNLMCI